MRRKYIPGTQRLLVRLDPEISDLVVELNLRGFKTLMSCAGHPPVSEGYRTSRGFISFAVRYNTQAKVLKSLFQQYGLRDVHILDVPNCPTADGKVENNFSLTFTAVGVACDFCDMDEGEGEKPDMSPEEVRDFTRYIADWQKEEIRWLR